MSQHRKRLKQVVEQGRTDEVLVLKADIRDMLEDLAAAEARVEEIHALRVADIERRGDGWQGAGS